MLFMLFKGSFMGLHIYFTFYHNVTIHIYHSSVYLHVFVGVWYYPLVMYKLFSFEYISEIYYKSNCHHCNGWRHGIKGLNISIKIFSQNMHMKMFAL